MERDVPWARLTVRRWAPRRTERSLYHIRGLESGVEYCVYNSNLRNMIRGIRERVYAVEVDGVLCPPPRPDPGLFAAELDAEASALDKLAFPTAPMTGDEFVALYVGRRHKVYQDALDSLTGQPVHRADADSCGFQKAEKVKLTPAKPDPAPRMIHPRSPRYNVSLGRYIRKIEHRVYRCVDEMWGDDTIMKGYNAQQVAGKLRKKWDDTPRCIALGLDASRFDQHVSVEALKWEHARYLSWFHGEDRRELARLLGWQLRTKCRSRCDDGVVKYIVDGMRFSGDMNTGLGNCLLMSSLVHAWCRKCGVNAALANNGDDCVLFIDALQEGRLDQDGMTAWFRRMGFTLKVESRATDFERIEFCQAQPVYNGETWVMCRKHGVANSKDCLSLKPLDGPRVFDAWRAAIGECGLALSSGVPVQQEFYVALARGAGDRKLSDPTMESGMARMAVGMQARWREVTPEARYSYWLAFGVSPDEQVALESVLRGRVLVYSPPIHEGTYECPPELKLFMPGPHPLDWRS